MSKWLLSLCLIALVGSTGLTYLRNSPNSRKFEDRQGDQARHIAQLTQELTQVQAELEQSSQARAKYDEDRARRADLRGRIKALETELLSARVAIDEQSDAIDGVGKRQEQWVRNELGKRMEKVNHDLDERWTDVSQTLEATVQIAEHNRDDFDTLKQSVGRATPAKRDVGALWADLMGPTVQISDESTVGSGTLLTSVAQKSGEYRTYLLTAWHVIRDILGDNKQSDQLIQVFVYHEQTARSLELATLVAHSAKLDSALLLMKSTEQFDHGARLPSRSKLSSLAVFDWIYAVGCPLGNDPIPTYGEISDTHHTVDGDHYWMINAPTYIGNSGGGIFDSESHELLGIFSKIYTHGTLRPTIVPHMGLVTPLAAVYDWLESVGEGHVLPK